MEQDMTQLIARIEELTAECEQLHQENTHLHNQINQFETLFNTLPNPVFYKDSAGRYSNCNTIFAETIFGLSKEVIIGKTLYELSHLMPADLREIYQQHDKKLIEEPGIQLYETQVRCADGKRHEFLFAKATFSDDQHKVAGVVGIMTDITDMKMLQRDLQTFHQLAEKAPDGIAVASVDGYISYYNKSFQAMYGYSHQDIIGQHIHNFPYEQEQQQERTIIETLFATGVWQGEVVCRCIQHTTIPVHVATFIIKQEDDKPLAIATIHRDMSRVKQAEAERAMLQEHVIDAQRAALREIGTPLLPLGVGILVMPLVGSIDTNRAQQIMETLLEGVAKHHATTTIIDLTGVHVVDTQVANALLQTAHAVKLLGAEVILTGIGSPMAQTLVSLGTDLSRIVTRNTLHDGIAYARKKRDYRQ